MSDNPARYGFRPYASRFHSGGPIPERGRLASGYSGADVNAAHVGVGAGDVLKKVSDGTYALAAATDAFSHVCVGVIQYWDGTVMRSNKVVPYGDGVYGSNFERETWISIIPVHSYTFEVDVDDKTTATSYSTYVSYIGENLNHVNSGDTTALRANPRLAIAGHATTNTLQWRIVDVSPTMENQDFSGSYVKLLVTANISQLAAGTAGTLTGV